MTVLDACKEVGIYVPTMCYDRTLHNHGKCRMCIVEIDDNLQLACETTIRNQMHIYTKTDKVIEAQKTVISLVLLEHNVMCLQCKKSGTCVLQDIVFRYDIPTSDRLVCASQCDIKSFVSDIAYDKSRCVSCGKCVKYICDVDFPNPDAFLDSDVSITKRYDSNTIVKACPTGALMEIDNDRS